MKDLVTHLAKSLVDNPDKVEVKAVEEGQTLKLIMHVADEDKGKIIGKQGKVIKALRALVSVAAVKTDRQVVVDIE